MITVGSLFSGIGGMELGLERTGGFKTIWFSEIDDYAGAVLGKHWPDVPNLGDITKIEWEKVEKPDMLAGGFPCQDISVAGKGKGIREGKRSGLWREYAKAIRILQPRYALIENVPELANRGGAIVLADLAEMGYDAEWGLLSASAVGALHQRRRMFIFAYDSLLGKDSTPREGRDIQDAQGFDRQCAMARLLQEKIITSDNYSVRKKQLFKEQIPKFAQFSWCENVRRVEDIKGRTDIPEPLLCGKDYGLSRGMDRIKCLGNAVVPQVAETIGYWILEWITRDEP